MNFIATVKSSEKLAYYWFNYNIYTLVTVFLAVYAQNIKTKAFSTVHLCNKLIFLYFCMQKVNRNGKEKIYNFQKRIYGRCVCVQLVREKFCNWKWKYCIVRLYPLYKFNAKEKAFLFSPYIYNTYICRYKAYMKYVG